ncbi:elongation factor 1-alpha, putative [Plasmodium gallinaceum]|uniref:glutamate--tRNA ligase n=1 Tax=Plasmodium gallinaceum TaxID=5849 RepID=A0A1J1GN82_PLAGA|nr:elongation factor 1-alpha, putative [Plasmodium gallinaceum]CRG93927.1 elongation factor 1-alpha, putative [Plasmodium gallinaceum]
MNFYFFLIILIIIKINANEAKLFFHSWDKKSREYRLNILHNKKYKFGFILKNSIKNTIKYNKKKKNFKNFVINDEVPKIEPRLRFAPSPTGYMHIGGCRTFLYNYILSKQMKGILILRFEDTDTKRNSKESLSEIINDLRWLKLNWDEGPDKGGIYGPYKQSERLEVYKKIAHDFVKQGKAYFCFCSKEELNEKKEKEKMMKKKYIYDRKCRYLNNEIIKKYLEQDKPYTIRYKSPINRKIILKDILKNNITDVVDEDFVILRSNKLPTYNFSASVDDHLMKVSHVIRGVEHISNTFKQILILESLNSNIPVYAHIPIITTSNKKKISKRNSECLIRNLRDEGFKPECVVNYMATLGWGSISKKEFYTMDELIENFNIHLLNKSSIVFDIKKLKWMNKKYLLKQDIETYINEAQEYLINNKILTNRCKEFVELCINIFRNEVHNYAELKENILNIILYNYSENYIDKNDVALKSISVLLYGWFEKYINDDSLEYILERDYYLLIENIVRNTNLKKKDILLKIRFLLTFQNGGIPFINLTKIWASAKKNNIKNYFSLKRRILYIKEIYNF